MDDPLDGRRPVRVLLVDDDESSRPHYAKQLGTKGFAVTLASDSESGLALARSTQPAIIFLHFEGPGSPAADFLQKLRAADAMRHIPVSLLGRQSSERLRKLRLNALMGERW